MKRLRLFLSCGIALAICFGPSMIHPWGDMRASARSRAPFLAGSSIPPEVEQTLETKCGDCHSDNTHWPVYSRVAPISWLVERDVHEGREQLNLSHWQQYNREAQMELLTRMAAEARSGQMPPKPYLRLHPQMQLSASEEQQLYGWAKAERRRLSRQAAQTH